MRLIFFFSIAVILLTLGSPESALAAPIYKSETADGKTIFTSKPPEEGAKPAELPEIMRGEVKIPKVTQQTCASRGGVNCEAGADSDGSVICFDGFRGADERFAFACTAAKLEVSDMNIAAMNGPLSVFVRNSKGVAAVNTSIYYQPPNGNKMALMGPKEIEPFGLAEYTLVPPGGSWASGVPTQTQIQVACANCP